MYTSSIYGLTAGTSGVTSNNSQDTERIAAKDELGKDAFLKILLTQLRCQNPLEPVKDQDFIAQMAQFSSLEQMQYMNKNLEDNLAAMKSMGELMAQGTNLGYAVGLIGREIEYAVETETRTGTVTAIHMHAGTPKLLVGENEISMEMITKIRPVTVEGDE